MWFIFKKHFDLINYTPSSNSMNFYIMCIYFNILLNVLVDTVIDLGDVAVVQTLNLQYKEGEYPIIRQKNPVELNLCMTLNVNLQ